MSAHDFGKVAVLLGGYAGAWSRGPIHGDATVEAYVGRPSDATAEGNRR
jgi:hypothetical protein